MSPHQVHDDIGHEDLLERGAEGRHEVGGQLLDEAHRVGQQDVGERALELREAQLPVLHKRKGNHKVSLSSKERRSRGVRQQGSTVKWGGEKPHLVVGSSVANMRSSARAPARVSELSSVLLPELV